MSEIKHADVVKFLRVLEATGLPVRVHLTTGKLVHCVVQHVRTGDIVELVTDDVPEGFPDLAVFLVDIKEIDWVDVVCQLQPEQKEEKAASSRTSGGRRAA